MNPKRPLTVMDVMILILIVILIPLGIYGICKYSDVHRSVTVDEYQRIEIGMSYSEVVDIIGKKGNHFCDDTVIIGSFKIESVSYEWKNIDGSLAHIMFLNDRLLAKHWED